MKKIILSVLVLLAASTLNAQSEKFVKGMEKFLTMLDSAKTPGEYNEVAAGFERIAEAEKNQWLPYYYASLSHVWKGFRSTENKDDVATKAEELINKAAALEKNNAEIYIVQNMIATLRMLVDPQSRWMQYGPIAAEALAKAKAIDAGNPRIYFLEGQSLFGTPTQFGGGKDKAKPVFEKSIALFTTYKPASNLHPHWGETAAKGMLERCN